jgi:hypothetical protein
MSDRAQPASDAQPFAPYPERKMNFIPNETLFSQLFVFEGMGKKA